jgi:hypothetical protein
MTHAAWVLHIGGCIALEAGGGRVAARRLAVFRELGRSKRHSMSFSHAQFEHRDATTTLPLHEQAALPR